MYTLNLKIMGIRSDINIYINGTVCRSKRNSFGSRVVEYVTEDPNVELVIKTVPHELMASHWFFMSMLFFFVSVFGIFDIRYSKNAYSFEYKQRIRLVEKTQLSFSVIPPKMDGRVLSSKIEEIDANSTNVYIHNPEIKNRIRILRICKFVFWVCMGVILYIIFSKGWVE